MDGPVLSALNGGDFFIFEPLLDHTKALARQEAVIDPAHHFRLPRYDLGFSILTPFIPIKVLVLEVHSSFPHSLSFSPSNILADGLAFCLGKSAHHRDDHLTVRIHRVDVFFFKNHCDSQILESSDIVQTIHCVPGKPGNRFHKDQVYFLFAAHADHFEKFRTLLSGCSGNTLIRKYPCHCPIRVFHNLICIVSLLCIIAGKLFLVICRNPAVSRNPELSARRFSQIHFRFWWDHRDPAFPIIHCAPPFSIFDHFAVSDI